MKLTAVFKTIGLILVFLAVVLILGYVIYVIFFKGEPPPPSDLVNINGTLVNRGDLPLANENVNRPLTANINGAAELPVVSPVATGGDTLVNDVVPQGVSGVTIVGGNLRYYDIKTGQFYQISPDGTIKTLLTDEIFPDVEKVAWSPDATQAILTFPDGTNILYNFNTKTQATLPKEMKEIQFSSTGTQIGYEYVTSNPDNNFLGIAKPNGSEIQMIEALGDQSRNVEVNWSPSSQVLATFKKGSAGEAQEIYFIGLQGENLKLLNVEGRGFESQWNEAGDKILYSTHSSSTNYNPELKFVDYGGDRTGQNVINTGLNTWPSKCAIGSGAAYCGVPTALGRGSGLYPEIAAEVPDNFYKIDFRTGAKTKLANPVTEDGSGGFNAENVFLAPDENILYFTDKNTGKLHSIRLK